MAQTKRKSIDGGGGDKAKGKRGKPGGKKQKKGADARERKGPRLPNVLRKEVERLNPIEDEDIDSDEAEVYGRDFYEYEEELPEEEKRKNRRFDPVENLEYQLPDEFEDENVSSEDDDNDMGEAGEGGGEGDDDDDDDDDGRQGNTRIPAFEGKKKRNTNVVVSEAYPESEYNPTRDTLDGEGPVSIEDLLNPLHGKTGYSKLRKRIHHLEKKSVPTPAPLPKADQEKLERMAAYEKSTEELRKWEPIIKRNREAPTIYFDDDMDLRSSTTSDFKPRTEFEKKIASLVYDDQVKDAHLKDGSRLLELNKVSAEDERDRHNRMAKMRSLLFRHEMKSKHIKKIKSKTYHRLLKKDRLKATSAQSQMDPDAAKELAMKQEYERAKERMTLRHKGSSKWTKRIKERGIDVQDEGTRAAIAEQQHLHAQLTRKMNSMKDGSSSSSDDSSDEDDIDLYSPGSDHARAAKLLEKAKEKTHNVLIDDDDVPNSGVLSLPFMVRGLKKKNEAAAEEAKLALQEYESWSNPLEDSSGADNLKVGPPSGRMVFNGSKNKAPESSNKTKADNKMRSDNYYANSDSEDDLEPEENVDVEKDRSSDLYKDVNISAALLHEDSQNHNDSLFKNFGDIVQAPGPKTTHEVSIFAAGSWKKIKSGNSVDANGKKSIRPLESVERNQNLQERVDDLDEDSDADSEGQMVDGFLTSDPKDEYRLPSQAELIRQAFAADDVEDEFEKEKQEVLNEENPEPEKPTLLPGWGQWTHVQKKKGLPSWMQKEHEDAKKKREETLKKRKDAHLKRVIISEKLDKKAEKLFTKTLPYPFTSKEVFEQSIRMPLGPEFNPASAVGALNRPEVMQRPGVIIRPVEFEEVNPQGKVEDHKQSGKKQKKKNKSNKSKSGSGKIVTKVKTKLKS
ncbi:hypothetical protein D8674_004844 [Pyrus ussuriensis x Pyrus communis]|uniref:U3 small nucleolar RNA-associated protein 14-like protein A n=1 Tax=Pyrus ussuriensis x Pyrus communis TaxID=2448454 RepID=A0A5N5FQE1_9ROSA|nr:hypothetical protein D8674_004844 [Pyrus ussuriensis x Pyrus communis]